MSYSNWKTDGTPEPDLLIGKRYVVKADISTCFPSIYTHSIPWALAGKATAKKNSRKKRNGIIKSTTIHRIARMVKHTAF